MSVWGVCPCWLVLPAAPCAGDAEVPVVKRSLEIAVAAQSAWWEALRQRIRTPRVSAVAASVAGDYRALGVEVLKALQAAEDAERAGAPGGAAASA